MNRAHLEMALEQAVNAHFCKLFDVLMAQSTDEQAMARFQAGVQKLAETDLAVSTFIAGEFL